MNAADVSITILGTETQKIMIKGVSDIKGTFGSDVTIGGLIYCNAPDFDGSKLTVDIKYA